MRLAGILILSSAAALCTAQTPQTASPVKSNQPLQQAVVTTLNARARLVIEDVVVSGTDHQPIRSLRQSDFVILENGRPQNIVNFEQHTALNPSATYTPPALPRLPPGVFTNLTPTPTNSASNILLLDALNTPLSDQDYLHHQILTYLKSAPSGTSIAIFGLNNRLVMLQGFTSDPAVLRAAAEQQNGHSSPLLPDAIGGGAASETSSDTAAALGIPLPAQVQESFALFSQQVSSSQVQLRARITLDAVNQLARYLAGIPGRKNLVWFSGSFPIDLVVGENSSGFSPFSETPAGEQEYTDTINLLARAQVAVYPVDVRGVLAPENFTAASSVSVAKPNPSSQDADAQHAFEHEIMRRMAKDTGGEAFINTNNLTGALQTAVTRGSNYYTLSYSPSDTDWNGKYRKIKVQLTQKGFDLAYRRGYYAADPDSRLGALSGSAASANSKAASPQTAALKSSLIHGIPVPTQILFKIRVLPAGSTETAVAPNNVFTPIAQAQSEKGFTRYVIDFDTEARDFTLTPRPDGKFDCKAEFAGLVYDPAGRPVNAVSSTLVAALTTQQRAIILRSGLPLRLQLSVPNQGTYTMRIGVEDLISGRTGAIELPVSAVSKLPHVNVPSGATPAAAPPGPKQ